MKKTMVNDDLRGVFAVPPLARMTNDKRSIDFPQNDLIVNHIRAGGITRLIYGGNAFLYHLPLVEFEQLLEWLAALSDDLLVIPSIGPSYGRALDQAALLRRYAFSCAMILPCGDPRDAAGLERGYREVADAAAIRLIVYLKDENNFGSDREAGLDAVARLVDDGVCTAIKYAVVREDPSIDPYLEGLLRRVPHQYVISGIGERPAVVHLRDWKLPGFTTGSGCVAPTVSQQLFTACVTGNWRSAEELRARFIPLEDLRDAWGPARVLHRAMELSGIAVTADPPPYVSPLNATQSTQLEAVSRALLELDRNLNSEVERIHS
jgi:dihydrodipicolinate synthase/N-acetylneuraminate lyase